MSLHTQRLNNAALATEIWPTQLNFFFSFINVQHHVIVVIKQGVIQQDCSINWHNRTRPEDNHIFVQDKKAVVASSANISHTPQTNLTT